MPSNLHSPPAPLCGSSRRVSAVIAAAGLGRRLQSATGPAGETGCAASVSPTSKAFVSLLGRPLAWHSLETIRACPEIDEIVLVVAPAEVERARRTLLRAGGGRSERVVAGGEHRQASVRAGLAEVSPDCDLVLVHDAARPCLRLGLVRRCLEAAARRGAVVAALPASDTVKEVGEGDVVTTTLERGRLWLVQTPQVFRYSLLVEAHEAAARAGFLGTDDASLVERLGHRVHVVHGDPDNIKVTYAGDVRRAERTIGWQRQEGRHKGSPAGRTAGLSEGEYTMSKERAFRSGIGFDAHAFAEGRPLVLAGVRFPGERGLLGHSDADVVCHAICDAVLGAMGAGDIGQQFPDTDPRYADISSLSLLARVGAMAREAGWAIENLDAVVIAEAPRIAPRLPEMRRAVAEALETEVERVSLKGKTTEGMGFTGRGEGVATQAVVLLRKIQQADSSPDCEVGRC